VAGVVALATALGFAIVWATVRLFDRTERAAPLAAARRSTLVRQIAEPLRVADPVAPAARNSPKRDIYLIVLEGHPNARVVRSAMGYDISRLSTASVHSASRSRARCAATTQHSPRAVRRVRRVLPSRRRG
jgi:hypothetical protein